MFPGLRSHKLETGFRPVDDTVTAQLCSTSTSTKHQSFYLLSPQHRPGIAARWHRPLSYLPSSVFATEIDAVCMCLFPAASQSILTSKSLSAAARYRGRSFPPGQSSAPPSGSAPGPSFCFCLPPFFFSCRSGGDLRKNCTARGGMQQLCAQFCASEFACHGCQTKLSHFDAVACNTQQCPDQFHARLRTPLLHCVRQ